MTFAGEQTVEKKDWGLLRGCSGPRTQGAVKLSNLTWGQKWSSIYSWTMSLSCLSTETSWTFAIILHIQAWFQSWEWLFCIVESGKTPQATIAAGVGESCDTFTHSNVQGREAKVSGSRSTQGACELAKTYWSQYTQTQTSLMLLGLHRVTDLMWMKE